MQLFLVRLNPVGLPFVKKSVRTREDPGHTRAIYPKSTIFHSLTGKISRVLTQHISQDRFNAVLATGVKKIKI